VLLCEDYPIDCNTEILSSDDIDEKVGDVTWYCSCASTQEAHARVYYDKLLELDRTEALFYKNFVDLSSNKDIMQWCRLKQFKDKSGFSDLDVKNYIATIRYQYKLKEGKYIYCSWKTYKRIGYLMDKYPFLKNIDFSKYKLDQSARHPVLDCVRYPI